MAMNTAVQIMIENRLQTNRGSSGRGATDLLRESYSGQLDHRFKAVLLTRLVSEILRPDLDPHRSNQLLAMGCCEDLP